MRFVVGPGPGVWKVLTDDGVDITSSVRAKSFQAYMSADDPQPSVFLEVYPDSLDVLTRSVDVVVLPAGPRTLWRRLVSWLRS